MATSPAYDPSIFPSAATYTAPAYAPYTFPSAVPYEHPFSSPIPTQLDPNSPLSAHPPIHGEPHLTSYLFPHLQAQPSPQSYCFPTPSFYKHSPAAFSTYPGPAPKPDVFSAAAYAFPSSSPVPYHSFYSATPAFPHATTYLDPTPTSVYTPTPSFSPNLPNWPLPAADPTPSASGILATAKFAKQTSKDLASESTPSSRATTRRTTVNDSSSSSAHHTSSPPKEVGKYPARAPRPHVAARTSRCRLSRPLANGVPSTRQPPITSPESPRSKASYLLEPLHANSPVLTDREPVLTTPTAQQNTSSAMSSTCLFRAPSTPTTSPSAEAQAPVEAAVLDIKRQLEEHQAQSQLQGELCKLRDRLSSLTTSASNTTTAPRPSVGFTPSSDGTEQSYFTLPADYPLERDVPEPLFDVYDDDVDDCSTEFVDVLSGTPKQQSHEEEQQDSEQLPKCVRQAPEVEQTTALNYISDVVGFTLELQQQEDERAGNCSVFKASNSFVTRSSLLSIEHSMSELRLLWDPGALAFPVTLLKNRSTALTALLVIALRGVFEEVMLDIPPAKPPDKYGNVCSSPQVIQLKVLKADNPSAHSHLNFLSCNSKQLSAIQSNFSSLESILSWQRGAFSLGNFAISALWRNTTLYGDKIFRDQILTANWHNLFPCISTSDTEHIGIFVKLWSWSIFSTQHILDSSMKKGIIFSSGRILPWNPRYAVLLLHYVLHEFLMDRVLCKSLVLNLMDVKHSWTQLLLQYHSWCTTLTAFPQVHYCCLPIVFDCLDSEPVQLVCYSSMFSSTATIASTMSMSTATTVHVVLVLNTGKIVQDKKNVAAVYHVLLIQLPMSNTSHIWDPGIESILFLHKGLHLHNIQLVHCSAIHIKNCTSMTSVCVASSEYPYLVGFLTDQWEFIHQQSAQANYNSKHLLLSSHDYVTIREMDIIFITYLPP